MVPPFVKQVFVASAPLLAAASVGGACTFPLVLLHQLKADDSFVQMDFDTASWVGSINGIAGIPSIFMPTIMQWRGRKVTFIAACLVVIVGWVTAYSATTATAILISESFHGFGTNSLLAISFSTISEMLSPKHRDWVCQSYAVVQALGMTLTSLLTQFLHWRTISMIMCVPMVLSILIALAWPESPYWLAYKGKFNKSQEAFFWLRGNKETAKRELNQLIDAQKVNVAKNQRHNKTSLKQLWMQISRRDFYVPALLMIALQYTLYGTGCVVILIYSIDMVQKATENSHVSIFGGVIMNGLVSIGIFISLALCRYFHKRTILLSSLVVIILALLSGAVVNYLQAIRYLPKDSMLCLYCLIVYVLCAGIGLFPIIIAVATELMPVKHRGIGGALLIIDACVMHSFSLKLAPYLFYYIQLWGTLLIYAVTAICCFLIIFKYVPQTSGRTLQDIENYYMYGVFDRLESDECQGKLICMEMVSYNKV